MDNVLGVAQSALVTFSGLVVEVNPTDVPAGSSPLSCDTDYTVASAKTRAGIQNVYAYQGSDVEAAAQLGQDIAVVNGAAWANPTNIETNTPGTYAAVTLGYTGGSSGSPGFDVSTTSEGGSQTLAAGPLTPSLGGEWAAWWVVGGYNGFFNPTFSTPSGWSAFTGSGTLATMYSQLQTGASPVSVSTALTYPTAPGGSWATVLGLFQLAPGHSAPSAVQAFSGVSGGLSSPRTLSFVSNVTAGNTILVIGYAGTGAFGTVIVSDSLHNTYTLIGISTAPTFNGATQCSCFFACATNIVGGACTVTVSWTGGSISSAGLEIGEFQYIQAAPATGGLSDYLAASAFPIIIPSGSSILGVEVQVNGKQSTTANGAVLSIQPNPFSLNTPTFTPRTFTLGATDSSAVIGTGIDQWGQYWTPAEVENSNFGFLIQASLVGTGPVTFDISGVELIVYYSPSNISQFDYVKTFSMTNGTDLTLALDNTGVFWQEEVETEPNVLTPFYTAIEPNTFARSVTQDDREFIALSNLINGTDMPRTYNGTNLDRLSQVGPGVSPAFTATTSTYNIVASPNGITQPAAVVNGAPGNPLRAILWGPSPGGKGQAGNLITIEYTLATSAPDPNLYVGGGVVLAGFQTFNGIDINTWYVIQSVQVVNTGNSARNSFTVQAPSSQNVYQTPQTGASYQSTLTTLTLTTPAAGVQVGTQVTIAGASPSAWDNTWTILNSLNASTMTITGTELSGGVAIYNFVLQSGTAPTVNQQVTVSNTTNGDGIFNIANGVIVAVSPTTFSIDISAPNFMSAAEHGNAFVNGTEFQFDPINNYIGTATNPILGNGGGGTIVQAGQLTAGTRMGTVMFLTRNGLLTAPAPPVTFTLNEGAATIVASNIPIGPPNVIARVIALTGANGAFFFWIPTPVTVTSNSQPVTYSATIVPDNITTQTTLTITDAVLLSGLSIDADGSNNFAQIELGSSTGVGAYAGRIYAWGEQGKVDNFLNLSFDGGYVQLNPSSALEPAGWTVDATYGQGGMLTTSPLFGNAYYILNQTGSTQTAYGMIWQTAYQDYDGVAIITPQTEYGVRVTAWCPSANTTGSLIVDLYSPSFNVAFGTFTLPFASMSTTPAIYTGNLLSTIFTTSVPADLRLRVWASGIGNNADVELDRVEPFNLAQPTLTTQLRFSYFENFEAFDQVTGNLGVGIQNQQPITNTFTLFDNLYVVKTASFFSTVDNGTTEPDLWSIKTVSDKVGTYSINGVDVGEGWALIAGEPGVYLFSGGDPVKISPELDGSPGVWQSISWAYGYTLWIRNDTVNRLITIGVPIPTPNQWMPFFPTNANPTQPNVVLACRYRELMTAGAIIGEGPIRAAYTGELKTFPMGRKWSAWSIEACYADFIKRGDTTTPLFFCGDTGTGKIYQQISGVYNDDGAAENCFYVTYPFPKTSEAEQMQMGLHQLLASFMSMTVIGSGNLVISVIPDTLTSPNQQVVDTEPLYDPPSFGDTEVPLNMEGDRFFVGLRVMQPNEWFDISRMVMGIGENPWAPVRGSN